MTATDATDQGALSRRGLILGAAATAAVGTTAARADASIGGRIRTDPFTLGVASGDPLPRAVVLWTRLAPEPTVDGGGMPNRPFPVLWEVAEDPGMRRVTRRGLAVAWPQHAHSVHVDVRWLRPDRDYWYRFRTAQHVSPIGRTRTAPRQVSSGGSLTMGLVSCQRYNAGYYTAYDDLVASEPDLVVHVGDYIYETGGSGARTDPLPESVTLDQYRNRYGLYKSDPSLRAAHAVAPWLFAWDDHEVENNYTGLVPEEGSATPDPEVFRARRAAAYKAYWEHMPLRGWPPRGEDLRIHRSIRWGRLAELFVLDTRQYRTDQVCGTNDIGGRCDAAFDPATTVLGPEQEAWLDQGLRRNRTTWAVLAQQVVFSQMAFIPGVPGIYNLDQWDGYVAARDRLLGALVNHRSGDNVVLTGDIHASGVSEVLADFDDQSSTSLGAEFVTTSVSSGSSSAFETVLPIALANNPHIQWAEAARRGWVRHRVTADEWRADYRLVDDATVPGAAVTTASRWSLPAGGTLTRL